MTQGKKIQKRVSIVNFKGGVGKTTLALHLATGLSSFYDKDVLLIDVDHQSTLSLVCLKDNKWQELVDTGKTIDAIFQHFVSQNAPLPGKEIIYKGPYRWDSSYLQPYPALHLIPSALQLDETELDLSSTTVGNPIESEWNKRTLICKWIGENKVYEDYDYIIFDCPPATKLVTQNAIAASHGFIIPVIPDAVSTRGVPHLIGRVFTKIDKKLEGLAQYLSAKGYEVDSTYVPSTKLVGIVISMIKVSGPSYSGYTSDQTTNLHMLQAKFPHNIIKPYVVDGVGVPEALARGYPVYLLDNWPNIRNRGFIHIFHKITDELKMQIDKL